MRLIDADELKYKNLAEVNGKLTYVLTTEEIDNAPTVEPKDYKWFDYIDNKLLKSRHGDFVIYKVDFLLDNLTREVYIMEGARRMRRMIRDCENCIHHSDNGCEVWECEFEKRSDA